MITLHWQVMSGMDNKLCPQLLGLKEASSKLFITHSHYVNHVYWHGIVYILDKHASEIPTENFYAHAVKSERVSGHTCIPCMKYIVKQRPGIQTACAQFSMYKPLLLGVGV